MAEVVEAPKIAVTNLSLDKKIMHLGVSMVLKTWKIIGYVIFFFFNPFVTDFVSALELSQFFFYSE